MSAGKPDQNNAPDVPEELGDESVGFDESGMWQDALVPGQSGARALVVDVEGFEGPLDLLLAMARTQKVDISQISVLALAEQYLAFIDEAQRLRLEVAADYLVMAAWLAFLKSRLLLPSEIDADEQLSAEDMAQRLSFRLMRLEAMRSAAAELMNRRRLGRDVFGRGSPEGFARVLDTTYTAQIYDLLKAYGTGRQRTIKVVHTVKRRTVWSVKDARKRLQTLIGEVSESWVQLDLFIERYLPTREDIRTVRASSFGATLEMAREGLVELRQDAPFEPIYMRSRRDRVGEGDDSGQQWDLLAQPQDETGERS